MEARFDGSDWNFQDVGDFAVFQVLVIGQNQRLAEYIGKLGHAFADPLPAFFFLELGQRAVGITNQKIDKASRVGVPRGRALIEADGGMPPGLSQRVNSLVSGDRIEPGTDGSAIFVQAAFQVNLKKGVLKHVFRERPVARVTHEIPEQLILVTMDQRVKVLGPAQVPIAAQQLLVRQLGEAFRRIRTQGLDHDYVPGGRKVRNRGFGKFNPVARKPQLEPARLRRNIQSKRLFRRVKASHAPSALRRPGAGPKKKDPVVPLCQSDPVLELAILRELTQKCRKSRPKSIRPETNPHAGPIARCDTGAATILCDCSTTGQVRRSPTMVRGSVSAILVIVALVFGSTRESRAQGYPPAEAAARMTVPQGLRVQPYAFEPMIRQPSAIEFDDRGRLWVIQYLQYPNPAGLQRVKVDRYSRTVYDAVPPPPPRGPRGADRITILEDTDGDGSADRAHDFLQGLNLASGLAFGHGGVFVLQIPYLLFYADRNRDDVPDGDPEVLLSGFGMEDAHSVANSLTWGPDGWLYGLQGSTVTAHVRGVEFQQGVWRYHPITREFELFCEGGGNMWGLDFDLHGNLFASTNVGGSLMLHAVQGAYCWKSFGKHGPLHNPYTYGYFEHVKHQGSATEGHVAVGGLFYMADAFPEQFRGRYLSGDLLGHSVHWSVLSPRGSTFESRSLGDLVRGNDTWFAPTDMTLGPDGSVYVTDWHDKRTAHPDPDADWDKTNGRIYAIRAVGSHPPARVDLAALSNKELIGLLSHPNNWTVRRARRLLIERRDPATKNPLRKLAIDPRGGQLGLEAFWAFTASVGLEPATAEPFLKHPSDDVRTWTVRLLGDRRQATPQLARALREMAGADPSVTVRCQLACTARRLPAPDGLPIVARIALRNQDNTDPYIPLLLWWAIEQHAVGNVGLTLDQFATPECWRSAIVRQQLLPRLIRRFAADGSRAGDDGCARLLATAPSDKARAALLESLEQGLAERPRGSLAEGLLPAENLKSAISDLWRAQPENPLLIRLAARLGDPDARSTALHKALDSRVDEPSRTAMLALLADIAPPALAGGLIDLVINPAPVGVQDAALRVLARGSDETIADRLLAAYSKQNEHWRSQVRSVLLSRRPWAKLLLGAVDRGKLTAQEVPLDELRAVALFRDAALDQLVKKHWGTVKQETPEERLAEVRRLNNDLRAAAGDPARGRTLFTKHCATCHRLFGEGNLVGPELTHANRKDRDFLLVSLVDPSAVVRKEFQSVVISTKEGRILTGLLGEQSPAQLTVIDSKAERTSVPRSSIEAITDSPISLMPENLYRDLKPDELRDLFAYLQGDGPADGAAVIKDSKQK